MKKIQSKKLFLFITGLLLLLLLSACGQDGTGAPAPAEEYTLEDITGYWKYDEYENYYYLGSDGTFQYFNSDGSKDEGTYTLEGNVLAFEQEEIAFDDLTIVNTEQLADSEGDTLSRFDPGEDQGFTMDDVAGYWKYDAFDLCYALYDTGTWESYDMNGSLLDKGSYTVSGNVLSLMDVNQEVFLTLRVESLERLIDEDGEPLLPFDPAFLTPQPVQETETAQPAPSGSPNPNGSNAGGYNEEPDPYDSDAGNVYYDDGEWYESNDAWEDDYEEPNAYDSDAGNVYYDDGEWYESNDADW